VTEKQRKQVPLGRFRSRAGYAVHTFIEQNLSR